MSRRLQMTQKDLFQQNQTSSHLDTHVNLSQSPLKKEKVQKTKDTSFRISLELLNKQDPLIVFSKMFMGMSHWDLTRFCFKWKASTTIRGHLYFRLHQSEHGTNEIESGLSAKTLLYATPNTLDHLPPRSAEATKKLQKGHRKGRKRPSNLREQVDPQTMSLYPTPTTKGFGHASEGQTMIFRKKVENGEMTEQQAQQMMNGVTLRPPRMKAWNYPTPLSRDWKDASYNPTWKKSRDKSLPREVLKNNEHGGKLNVNFTEFLMGYPMNWTKIEQTD